MNKQKVHAKRYPNVDINNPETVNYILEKVKESNVINFTLYESSYGSWVNPIVRADRYYFPILIPNKHIVINAHKEFPVISFQELKLESSYDAGNLAKQIHGILLAKWQKYVKQAMNAQIVKAQEIRDGEGSTEPDENTND